MSDWHPLFLLLVPVCGALFAFGICYGNAKQNRWGHLSFVLGLLAFGFGMYVPSLAFGAYLKTASNPSAGLGILSMAFMVIELFLINPWQLETKYFPAASAG